MDAVHVTIDPEGTGKRIRDLMEQQGVSARDIRLIMGFTSSRAVYKWLQGQSLPSIDNLYILSRVLHVRIEDLLEVDGDIFVRQEGREPWHTA